jgi:hypothetical protein
MNEQILNKICNNGGKPLERRGVSMPMPNPFPAFTESTQQTNNNTTEKK